MERTIIAKLFFLLFFSISLLFSSSEFLQEIDSLYKKIPYASKKETAQILHELENYYIRSVVSEDKKGTIKTLRGIIKCQKLLGLNTKTYEHELKKITGNYNTTDNRRYKNSSTKTRDYKRGNFKPKIVKTTTHNGLKIKSIRQKKESIIIKFNKPMNRKNLLFFEINRDGIYKDIYDIKANLTTKVPKISLPSINKIHIAQNRENKVRIVLEDSKKIYSNAYIRNGTLFIEVKKNPNKHKPKIITLKKPEHYNRYKKHKKTKPKKSIYASSKIIVIDPGHGGKDAGAVGYKRYKEKIAVLKISKILQNLLKKKGYKVYLTRSSDKFVKLSQRTHFANLKNADLFISIHANASPKSQKLTLKGIETFFLSPAKTEKAKRIAAKENRSAVTSLNEISKDTLLSFLNRNKIIQSNKLAIDLQKGMLSQVHTKYRDVKDGGVREAPFWVLVGAQMPAVLIEIGYITNPKEADRLFNPFYQKLLAQGISNGIDNYFINNY